MHVSGKVAKTIFQFLRADRTASCEVVITDGLSLFSRGRVPKSSYVTSQYWCACNLGPPLFSLWQHLLHIGGSYAPDYDPHLGENTYPS